MASLRLTGVYKIENITNGYFYIGSSININGRWSAHKSLAASGSSKCPKFYNCIRKYGVENFKLFILELCELDRLIEVEQKYVNMYINDVNCLNIAVCCEAPARGRKFGKQSPELIERRISKIRGRKWENINGRGIKRPKEHCDRQSKRLVGNTFGRFNKGIKKCDSHGLNVSLSRRKTPYPLLKDPSGNIVEVGNMSLANFSKIHNLTRSAINHVILKTRPTHKGWRLA